MKTYIITIDERTILGKAVVEKLKSLGVEMKKIDKREVTTADLEKMKKGG